MSERRGKATVHTVTSEDTARALGSGDLEVLATPRLLAWCEKATCAALTALTALTLDEGSTSVGTHVELEHLHASPVGSRVTTSATVVNTGKRRVRFEVTAHDQLGQLVGKGSITRAIVNRERFLAHAMDVEQ